MSKLLLFRVAAAFGLLAAAALSTGAVGAATTCAFTVAGTTMTLQADCTTDTTILISDGFTLDGAGHTITAVDPVGGHFVGAVVKNGGASAHVQNLTVTAAGLADVCDEGDARLRGIMFQGASGSIVGSTVTGINQGASGCQEGNAIEVRNFADLAGIAMVEIGHNTIIAYQKTGIVANGAVSVNIHHNDIGASATQANLAANSVQIGFGGTGSVTHNSIAGNSWCCADAAATAILLYESAAGTTVSHNDIGGNADVGIYVFSDGVTVDKNKVYESGPDGFYDVGIGDYGTGNSVTKNKVSGYDLPYDGVVGGKNQVKKSGPAGP